MSIAPLNASPLTNILSTVGQSTNNPIVQGGLNFLDNAQSTNVGNAALGTLVQNVELGKGGNALAGFIQDLVENRDPLASLAARLDQSGMLGEGFSASDALNIGSSLFSGNVEGAVSTATNRLIPGGLNPGNIFGSVFG